MFSSINSNIQESDAAFNRIQQRDRAIAAGILRLRSISEGPDVSKQSSQVRLNAEADKVMARPRSTTISGRIPSNRTFTNAAAQRRKPMANNADAITGLRIVSRPSRLSTVEEPESETAQIPCQPDSVKKLTLRGETSPPASGPHDAMRDVVLEMASDESGAHFPLQRMTLLLNDIFKPFINPRNNAAITILINERLRILKNMEIGPDELAHRLENAKKVDQLTALVRGAAASAGFIVGTQGAGVTAALVHENLPGPWVPLVPGFTIGLIDQLYGGFLEQTKVGYYLQPAAHLLEPAMEECLASRRRPLLEECTHQANMLAIPFTARNVIRSLMSPVAGAIGHAELVDTLIDGMGGLPAGAASEALRGSRNRERELAGPAYLLGARDWEEQLASLQHGCWSACRIKSMAAKTMSKAVALPSMLWTGMKSPFSLSGLTEIITLSNGLALIDRSKQWMIGQLPNSSTLSRDFFKSAIGTVALASMYYFLGINMTLAARCGDLGVAVNNYIKPVYDTCREFFCAWLASDDAAGQPQARTAAAPEPIPLSVIAGID